MKIPDGKNNSRAIIAMLAAMAVFTASDSLMKFARESVPAGESIALRGVVSTVFACGLVLAMGQRRQLGLAIQPRVMLRSGLELAITLAYITAIAMMPLAELTAISQSNALMMTLACALLGLERVPPARWAAVIVGFAGVLLVVKPGPGTFEPASLLALLCAVLIAARDLVNRGISPVVPTSVILLATAVAVMLGGFALGVGEGWTMPGQKPFLALMGAGLLVALGHLGMILAFRDTDVGAVSPFRYSVILWAGLAGYMFFDEWPDPWAWAGAFLIVASGIFTLHRETTRRAKDRDDWPTTGPLDK